MAQSVKTFNRRFTRISADEDLLTAEAQRAQRNQLAVGTRQQESKYKRAVGKNQTPVSSKKSTPPPGFLNSDLPTAYCYLPTSFPQRTLRLCGEISESLSAIIGENLRLSSYLYKAHVKRVDIYMPFVMALRNSLGWPPAIGIGHRRGKA